MRVRCTADPRTSLTGAPRIPLDPSTFALRDLLASLLRLRRWLVSSSPGFETAV